MLGKPTRVEAKWMDDICRIGCIACRVMGRKDVPGMVHHMLSGSVRRGHTYTLCLCFDHHHSGCYDDQIVSRHPWKTRFEKLYGSEIELLCLSQKLVKELL